MVGSRAEKDHSSRVGKNWLMMGSWKTRATEETGAGAVGTARR